MGYYTDMVGAVDLFSFSVSGKVDVYFEDRDLINEFFRRGEELARDIAALTPRPETAVGRFIRAQT